MIEILLILFGVAFIALGLLFLSIVFSKKNKTLPVPLITDNSQMLTELQHHVFKIKKEIEALPEDILHTITGSANTHKGKLGELIGYISLKAEYDKIIPLGGIVDFICLSFPKDDKPGQMVFIDIKTGKNARLNPDQRMLRKIIQEGNIKFIKFDIDAIDVLIPGEEQ